MVIETFIPGKVKELYEQLDKGGRQLPNGVHYLDSWIDERLEKCYQVMESGSFEKFLEWTKSWSDYAAFVIVPVIKSAEAKARVLSE